MNKKAILGIGNLIKGDDGVGIQVIQELRKNAPKNVDLIDAGTTGLNILNFMEQYEEIIVVDAINLGYEKGEIVELKGKDIPDHPDLNLSAHDIDFVDSLQVSKELGINTEITVIGIEIGEIKSKELTMELSEEIKKSIPKIKEKIKEKINN